MSPADPPATDVAPATARPPSSVITHGLFVERGLADLLETIARHERAVMVTLSASDGSTCGRMLVCKGTVVLAEAGAATGRDAFFALCADRPARYTLSPLATPVPTDPAVGPLGALLLEATSRRPRSTPPPPPRRRALLEPRRRDLPRGVLAVVSGARGAGRTTVAAGIARAFARRGARVAAVSVDGTNDLFAQASARGLSMHVLRPADVQDVASWRNALVAFISTSDLVIIDAPAGFHGTAGLVLGSASHWLTVIPLRSHATASVVPPDVTPPSSVIDGLQPAGIVLNGFRVDPSAAVPTMRAAALQHLVLDTILPWSPIFAGTRGDDGPDRTAWLFDALADELAPRLGSSESTTVPTRLAAGTGPY